jgi:TonB family protein
MWSSLVLAAAAWAGSPPEDEPAPPAPAEVPADLPIESMPAVLQAAEAVWPAEARAQGLEGVVTLRITLDAEGAVTSVEVVGPAGNGFDEAAIDAVKRSTWSPARTAAGPVAVVFDFQYGFVLEE